MIDRETKKILWQTPNWRATQSPFPNGEILSVSERALPASAVRAIDLPKSNRLQQVTDVKAPITNGC